MFTAWYLYQVWPHWMVYFFISSVMPFGEFNMTCCVVHLVRDVCASVLVTWQRQRHPSGSLKPAYTTAKDLWKKSSSHLLM